MDKIAKARKIYIPEYVQRVTWDGERKDVVLWHGDEKLIVHYIGAWISEDPEKALRFSWIYEHGWDLQMLIPTNIINSNGLDLWSKCFETKEELKKHSSETIEWERWGIDGESGNPSIETFVPWIDDV
jgi:hypothetical protein